MFNKDNYNGIFEAYKENAIKVLQEEYNTGRLTGSDYANALVQVLGNIVLEASKAEQAQEQLEANTKLALSKQVKENEYTDARIKLTLKQIDEIDNNLKLKYMSTEKQIEKTTHEISKIDSDIKVSLETLQLEKLKVNAEVALNNAKIRVENKDLELKEEQLNLAKQIDPILIKIKQKELEIDQTKVDLNKATIDLTKEQIQQIRDNKYIDMFGKQLDAWSLMFTSGLLEDKPSIISDDRVTELYNYLADYQ